MSEQSTFDKQIKIDQDKIILKKRFGSYIPPKTDQVAKYKEIQEYILEVALLISKICPDSPQKSTALTHLESCKMYANASIALNS